MKLLKPIKPHPDLVIRNPATGARVPLEGIVVDENEPFWARRLIEGSMTAEEPPAAPATPQTAQED